MRHLLGLDGRQALSAVLKSKPLLAFDFDGTIAPIVERPQEAQVAAPISHCMTQLTQFLPVAIVTGRAVDDIAPRLGFVPDFIVGNHGAESQDRSRPRTTRGLDRLRARLADRVEALSAAGIIVEDKGLSMALHYRQSPDREAATWCINRLLSDAGANLRTFGGKFVVNVVPADAPDKAHAIRDLVLRTGSNTAAFFGDDINDEPVYASAPATWLTVRVGRDDPHSRARFFLDDQSEMEATLQLVLGLLPAGSGALKGTTSS